MKRIAILLLAAFITTASLPVFAQEVTSTKDECLLSAKDCKTDINNLVVKIKKLQAEIKKGKKAYTADDIKKLDAKLKEANEMLDVLLSNP